MTYDQAKSILQANNQSHVLMFWETLDAATQQRLLKQIASLDFTSIERMKQMLTQKASATTLADPLAPEVVEFTKTTHAEAYVAGEKELRAGKVAVLLVAGGQGSRLGYEGPKGAYNIGPITNSPLFYFHARKILGLNKRYNTRIPFYIMTSDVNDAATQAHFAENNYFGMSREDVIFFQQGVWPALTAEGKIILDQPGHIFMSPDGHGGTISALEKNGCLADMQKRGIATIFFFQVDNPMVEIADPAFIGLHITKKADFSLKLCAKRDAKEGMGVVAIRGNHFEMIEYTELTDEQANRKTANGDLYFKYGSPAIHIFSFDFLKQEATCNMPLHIAFKKIPICAEDGTVSKPEKNNGYKFEKFIFDVMPDAKTVVNLAFDRADEFSPVKNAEGSDSPATCKRDMQAKWRRWFSANGVTLPEALPVEIDPAYALDANDLKKGLLLR